MSVFGIISDRAADKLRIVGKTPEECASLSVVARRNGFARNLLHRWRSLILEGGSVALSEDYGIISNRLVRQLEERSRELERHLGRLTPDA